MDIYNSEHSQEIWKETKDINKSVKVGFPHAIHIINLVTRQLKMPRDLVEDALQEAWMDLLAREHTIKEPFGFLLAMVRNKALGIRRGDFQQRGFYERTH